MNKRITVYVYKCSVYDQDLCKFYFLKKTPKKLHYNPHDSIAHKLDFWEI